jgi:hypothetical protein
MAMIRSWRMVKAMTEKGLAIADSGTLAPSLAQLTRSPRSETR